jgi:hypothetical protein
MGHSSEGGRRTFCSKVLCDGYQRIVELVLMPEERQDAQKGQTSQPAQPHRARFADSSRIEESARRARRAKTHGSANKLAVSEEAKRAFWYVWPLERCDLPARSASARQGTKLPDFFSVLLRLAGLIR